MKKALYAITAIMMVLFITACVEIDVSEVTSVALNFTPKDAYLVDEPVVLDDMELTVMFETGDPQTLALDDADIVLTGAYLDNGTNLTLDTATSGEKTLSVSYQDVSAVVTFNVYDTIVETTGYTSDYQAGFVSNTTNPLHSAYQATAADGRIYVSTGTYTESTPTVISDVSRDLVLYMNKNMTLVAGDDVMIEPESSVYRMVQVENTTGVTIEGFIFSDAWTNIGIIAFGENTEIINNFINAPESVSANGNSIQISGSNAKVTGNTVYATNITSSTTWDGSAVLIAASRFDISNIEVNDNTVIREIASNKWNNGIAISVQDEYDVSDVTIDGNVIVGGLKAISLEIAWGTGTGSISSVDITDNTFVDVDLVIQMGQLVGGLGDFTDITITRNVYEFDGDSDFSPLNLVSTVENQWDSFDWNAFRTDNGLDEVVFNIEPETFWNGWGWETYSWIDLT